MAIPLSYNVRSLLLRRWTNAFSAGGIALVVAATMLLAALVGGLQTILTSAGEPDNLVVMRKGATSDGSSQVPRDAALAIRAMPGIARGADGQPLVSPEIVNQPFMHTPEGGRENVLVRGVERRAFDVHRSVKVVRGRMFEPKLGEVVMGADAARRYGGRIGGTVRFGHDPTTSALDVHCKAHDVDNLYVVDASFFPSSGAVNPATAWGT